VEGLVLHLTTAMRPSSTGITVCADCLRGLGTASGRRYNGVSGTRIGRGLYSEARERRRGIAQASVLARRHRERRGLVGCVSRSRIDGKPFDLRLGQRALIREMSEGMSSRNCL
jgi:hypothetical protein